jgi:hypothetical protein
LSRDVRFASQAFGSHESDQSEFKLYRKAPDGTQSLVDNHEVNSREGDAFEAQAYKTLFASALAGKLVRVKWDLWKNQMLESTDCPDPAAPAPCEKPEAPAQKRSGGH